MATKGDFNECERCTSFICNTCGLKKDSKSNIGYKLFILNCLIFFAMLFLKIFANFNLGNYRILLLPIIGMIISGYIYSYNKIKPNKSYRFIYTVCMIMLIILVISRGIILTEPQVIKVQTSSVTDTDNSPKSRTIQSSANNINSNAKNQPVQEITPKQVSSTTKQESGISNTGLPNQNFKVERKSIIGHWSATKTGIDFYFDGYYCYQVDSKTGKVNVVGDDVYGPSVKDNKLYLYWGSGPVKVTWICGFADNGKVVKIYNELSDGKQLHLGDLKYVDSQQQPQ